MNIFGLTLRKQKHYFHGLGLNKEKDAPTNQTDGTGRKPHPGLLKCKCMGAQH